MTRSDAEQSPDRNVERVRARLLERSLTGLRKYGVTTERTDLSLLEWLDHLQCELLDAAIYVERLKAEAAANLTASSGSH